jgi:hypothetical protein
LTTEDTSVIGGQWTDMHGQAVSKPNDIKLPPSRTLKTMMMLEQDRCSTIDGQGSWRWDDLEWTVVRSDHRHPAQDYQPDPLIPSFLQVAFGLDLPSAHPAWSVDPHGPSFSFSFFFKKTPPHLILLLLLLLLFWIARWVFMCVCGIGWLHRLDVWRSFMGFVLQVSSL